jgi:signal-transduction protein with cAMP-binding, CBS, and nucleotidyltransferase domain
MEVARRLCDDSIHAIFVLDEHGHARGIVSQTDLADAYVQGEWQELTAGAIMNPDLVTITCDTPLEIAAAIMLNRNIHRLLVVQKEDGINRPLGVLSLSDVVCEMANE